MSNTSASIDASIAAAVEAKIHATVFEALAGDDTIGRYVTAALQAPVTVKDKSSFRDRQSTWLQEALWGAIQEAAKAAVAEAVDTEREATRAAVPDGIRAQASKLAGQMVDTLAETVKSGWSVHVNFEGRR